MDRITQYRITRAETEIAHLIERVKFWKEKEIDARANKQLIGERLYEYIHQVKAWRKKAEAELKQAQKDLKSLKAA